MTHEIRNPEFLRQIWLEWSRTRVLVLSLVLAVVATALWLEQPREFGFAAQVGIAALLVVYGARMAHASLADELAQSTWDMQRLSALTPWQLSWGKLAGSTSLAWYGAALCALAWLIAAWRFGQPLPGILLLAWALGGIAAQALGLLLALAELQRGGGARGMRGLWLWALLLPLPWLVSAQFERAPVVVRWWGADFDAAWFWVLLLAQVAAWLVLGAQRLMSAQLQRPLPPQAWIGLHLWLALYLTGFLPPGMQDAAGLALAAGAASITLGYATLFIEPLRWRTWQQFSARWGTGRIPWPQLPLAIVSASLALGGGLAAALLSGTQGGSMALPLLAAALLLVRDLGIAAALQWRPRVRRADAALLVLLLLLYIVLPWLARVLGWDALAAVLLPWRPDAWQGPGGFTLVAAAFLQALAGLFLAGLRARAMTRART